MERKGMRQLSTQKRVQEWPNQTERSLRRLDGNSGRNGRKIGIDGLKIQAAVKRQRTLEGRPAVLEFDFRFWILSSAITAFLSCLCSLFLPVFASWPEPRRAPAAVERRDRRERARHGRQRHQAQQQQQRLQRRQRHGRRPGPLHQQLFFNYLLLLQPRQSFAAHLAPFHRQRTVPHPQPQKRAREGAGAGKRAREVNGKIEVSHALL